MSLNTGYSSPDDSPGLALWRVTMNWQAQQRATLKQFALTHVQFVLLAHLAALELAPVTQSQLAQHARVDPMMTSQVIRTLEKANLVARAPHPTDARAHLVTITPAGAELAGRATPDVEATDRRFFAPLGDDIPDLLTALRALGD